jgi:O-antigen biosynthesis protein
MRPPRVSVVVPSLARPRELTRCLAALGQLRYRPFEIVVVACAAGRDAIAGHAVPWLRVVPNTGTGIGAARNAGIDAAAGEIVAFIDDDAVPEPTWLDHLVAAMEDTGASAATGHVRGRNGISFQWRDRVIRRDGSIDHRPGDGDLPLAPPAGAGVTMLEGTNMAFRRDILAALGGFEPAFRFYLDDADIALRLHDAGELSAVVPLAQVHHGFAPSARRRRDRMPLDLFDIGRSLAIFLRAHLSREAAPAALALHREGERRRLLRAMVAGLCEPRDIGRLLARFDDGAREGMAAPFGTARDVAAPPAGAVFREDVPPDPVILVGRPWSRREMRRAARAAAARGVAPSLFVFGPTALFHRMRYDAAGYWEQAGGLFGRSDRDAPLFRFRTFRQRLAEETGRVAKVRGLPESRT